MIRYFAGHPTAANLMMIAFLVIGLLSVPDLSRETFPRIELRRVEVSVAYPGARPEDVEEAICQRIEDAVDGINNVSEIECEAKEGIGRAVVEMTEGQNLDRFFAEVKTEVDAIDDFPEKAGQTIVRQLGRTDFVASVAITGPESRPRLKAYAEAVKDRMLQWGGISKVSITGFSDRQIRIELADGVLRQFGLSTSDIADAIGRQSVDLPAGSIKASDREVLVRFADERKRLFEFLDLVVVSGEQGGQVRLGDIATISDRFELDEDKILFNGRPAALLEVSKTDTEDTLDAIDAINAFLEHERRIAPPGVEMAVTKDLSSIVRDRLNLLVKNGLQGLVLVFLVLWLFFGFRYSFWVAMGLPVSFLGAIALMLIMDYSINMLTMVGLLIAIGLLMDDAIVISENVAALRQNGLSPLDAATEGARQVFPSILASFTTTACVFGSLAFLKGDIGQILKVVPVVMLFVLSISLIEAFFILPSHLNHALSRGSGAFGRVQSRVNRWLTDVRGRVVGPIADRCVAWRYLTIGTTSGVFLLAVSLPVGGVLKFMVFPDIEGDTIEVRVLLPQGTPLARTESVVGRIVDALQRVDETVRRRQPDGGSLIDNVTLQFNRNIDAFEQGPHVATVTVDLLGAERRQTTIDEILALWRRETGAIPDVIGLKFTEPVIGPGGLAIDIRLKGTDLAVLKQASTELQDWLRRYRGTQDIGDDLRPGKREVRLSLKEGAATLGIDARMIADQLRTAFFGTTVSEIQVGSESFEVDVRLVAADRNSLADLDYFTVATPGGDLIPITVVAEAETARGVSRINRVNGLRTVTVQGDVDGGIGNADAIVADTLENFIPGLLERHPGVSLALEGQKKEAQTTQRSTAKGFLVGLIGVFLLLSFQFRSFVEPLIVMVAIPFAFIGAIAGHLIMGLDFTMPSMLGFVSMAGVVVNDSILLVNAAKRMVGKGLSVAEAAPRASRARFRAILLTSLTTVAGLLPILSETNIQAQVLIPLVTSLVFGLLASTILVLLVVPALYVALDDLGLSTIGRRDKEA